METKTVKEWLEELPEPYRNKALHNMKHPNKCIVTNIKDAIMGAFVWSESKEGHDYWDNLYSSL